MTICLGMTGSAATLSDFTVRLTDSPPQKTLEVVALTKAGKPDRHFSDTLTLLVNRKSQEVAFEAGMARTFHQVTTSGLVLVRAGTTMDAPARLYHFYFREADQPVQRHIPLWWSVIPPLLAIFLALIFKEVVLSLFAGIFFGAFVANGLHPELLLLSMLQVVDKYLVTAMSNPDHVAIIVFSTMIGGMVAVISRNGGMAGVIARLSHLANSARNTQLVTWAMGVLIFFDDYANTLIVGSTMRAVTDKFRISREKLAYLVDSTAAPIAAIAFITTWIGAELGYIQGAVDQLGLEQSAYGLFFRSLAYAYYPVLALAFILILVYLRKDFGPMYKAETRARTYGVDTSSEANEKGADSELKALRPLAGIPHRWYNAVLPVLTVVVVTIAALLYSGYEAAVWADTSRSFLQKLSTTIGAADSYLALLWASLGGTIVALLLTTSQRLMSLTKGMETVIVGFKTMLPAVVILTLAWSLAAVTAELHTARFLTDLLSGNLHPYLLPPVTFVLAAFIAFSTGSSWGTMAILYPLILPTAWATCLATGMSPEESLQVLYPVISVVLAGAVLGDHCSPISDTTILSSLASGCNHMEHVNTQLPYALTVGGVSTLLLTVVLYFSLPAWLTFPVGAAILFGIVYYWGKQVEEPKE